MIETPREHAEFLKEILESAMALIFTDPSCYVVTIAGPEVSVDVNDFNLIHCSMDRKNATVKCIFYVRRGQYTSVVRPRYNIGDPNFISKIAEDTKLIVEGREDEKEWPGDSLTLS